MTAIFIFSAQPDSNLDHLVARLPQIAGERYPIENLTSWEALEAQLSGVQQAVVLAPLSTLNATELLHKCRAVLPATSIIGILAGTDGSDTLSLLEVDCHWLSATSTDFELKGTLNAAIRQVELLAQLTHGVQLDEVTNLLNRAFFMRRLEQEVSLARRHKNTFCCVLIGIEYYRLYLDSYGYQFVNALLRFVTDLVGNRIRKEDLQARLSDDEIVLFLPQTSEEGARILAERLVATLNQTTFVYGEYQEEISVSAGLIGYPLVDFPNATADTVIRYGRHALFQAKENEEPDQLPVRLFSEIHVSL